MRVNSSNGRKRMKSKDFIRLVVTTGSYGSNCPLLVIGKSKMNSSVNIFNKVKLSVTYKQQKNSCFDKYILMHWLIVVFW